MNATIIINPAAGPAHRRRGLESIDAWVRGLVGNLDADTVVRVTEGPGHAPDLSRQAIRDGADLVIAWGGDGTINEVGAALVYSGVVLGIVPAGSGNGLARELGIPAQAKAALAVAYGSTERVVDAGELNGRLFFNVAGLGYAAQVAHTFAQSSGRMRGLAAYVVTAVRELLRYRAAHYAITVDEGAVVLDLDALFISVANTRQWGSGAQIAPGAKPDDGLLDVVVVRDRPRLVILAQMWRLFTGSVHRIGGTLVLPARTLLVMATPASPLHLDGEPLDCAERFEIRIKPAALRVRVPG